MFSRASPVKSSRMSPPKLAQPNLKMELLRPYAPDYAGNVRHSHILEVGSRVERKIDEKYTRQKNEAIVLALRQEREQAAARLVLRLEKFERKTVKRIEGALEDAAKEHAENVKQIHIQRDEMETAAIHATRVECDAQEKAALHEAKRIADERLVRELHLHGIETTNMVTKTMIQLQTEALTKARIEADKRQEVAMAQLSQKLKTEFEAELTRVKQKLQDEIDSLTASLACSGSTNVSLEDRIKHLNIELESTKSELENTIADYRRTLACNLPNYDEKHAFLF